MIYQISYTFPDWMYAVAEIEADTLEDAIRLAEEEADENEHWKRGEAGPTFVDKISRCIPGDAGEDKWYNVPVPFERSAAAVMPRECGFPQIDTRDELHTILAALRFYQENGQGDPANRSDMIHDIATNGDECISLDADAIDRLCEKINV